MDGFVSRDVALAGDDLELVRYGGLGERVEPEMLLLDNFSVHSHGRETE